MLGHVCSKTTMTTMTRLSTRGGVLAYVA